MKRASAMCENATSNSEIFVGSAAVSTPGKMKLNQLIWETLSLTLRKTHTLTVFENTDK
jgi:hypothetical protein